MALIRHCCTQLWLCRVCDKICLNQIFLIINILSTDDDVVGSNCCNIVNIICQCINPCITSNNTNNFLLPLLVTWTWSLPWWSWWQYLCSRLWSATILCPSHVIQWCHVVVIMQQVHALAFTVLLSETLACKAGFINFDIFKAQSSSCLQSCTCPPVWWWGGQFGKFYLSCHDTAVQILLRGFNTTQLRWNWSEMNLSERCWLQLFSKITLMMTQQLLTVNKIF